MQTIEPKALTELIAKIKARKAARLELKTPEEAIKLATSDPEGHRQAIAEAETTIDRFGNEITYNAKQQEFINAVSAGEDVVLIGAAGTGKTTCMRGAVLKLIETGKIGAIAPFGHKHLPGGTPGIVISAYTRRAVNNIRKNVSEDVKPNCITIHKLLEYEPVIYYDFDPITGKEIKKMIFEPKRDRARPISSTVRAIAYEEASMLGLDLYDKTGLALPHKPQEIFLGDIQQLPPIFGPAILGFKLQKLRVVELTEVYRQALESPILRLAHRILSGVPIPVEEYKEWHFEGQLKIHPWKKKISPTGATSTIANFFATAVDSNKYNPAEDIILMPFNKSFGTIEVNRHIATHLSWKRDALVHEIVAGYNKHYFAVGDKVMYEKNDAVIIKIETNPAYSGAQYQPASINLNYWGHRVGTKAEPGYASIGDVDDIDFVLSQVAGEKEDRVRQCSHQLTLRLSDAEVDVVLDTASAVNNLALGYAISIHKAQGSEWEKVFLIFHQSHNIMLQREMLYTAVTRAKKDLYIICEPETFTQGIEKQRIKGNTLAEKAEYFKGKYIEEEA
jgi:exodeoxyribonuclease V alpha subunit